MPEVIEIPLPGPVRMLVGDISPIDYTFVFIPPQVSVREYLVSQIPVLPAPPSGGTAPYSVVIDEARVCVFLHPGPEINVDEAAEAFLKAPEHRMALEKLSDAPPSYWFATVEGGVTLQPDDVQSAFERSAANFPPGAVWAIHDGFLPEPQRTYFHSAMRDLEKTLQRDLSDAVRKGGIPTQMSGASVRKDPESPRQKPPDPEADDLTRIKGIGPRLQEVLNAAGISRLSQIADLTPGALSGLSQAKSLFDRATRDNWMGQASFLLRKAAAGTENTPSTQDPPPPHISDAAFRSDRAVETMDGDTLDRIAIAEAIEEKVTGVWKEFTEPGDPKRRPEYPSHPFIVHLGGSWGSGKSSVLNFLKLLLQKQTGVTLSPPPGKTGDYSRKGWVVIEFNAWRHQHTGQGAWWALRTAVAKGASGQIGARASRFGLKDKWWRIYSAWRNWIIGSLALVALIFLAAIFAPEGSNLPALLTLVGTITGGIVGAVNFTNNFATRAQRTAEAIKSLDIDPTAEL